MKKLSLVLSALLCALVMVSCANPAGGKDNNSKDELTNGLYQMVKMVSSEGTVEGAELEAGAGTNELYYINYVDGKFDIVYKTSPEDPFKIIQENVGILKSDNTFEMTIPNVVPSTKITGTWKYENKLLVVNMTMGNESESYTYKRLGDVVTEKVAK